MRFTTLMVLALTVGACGGAPDLLEPAGTELAPQFAVAPGEAKYDAAAAKVVVDDLVGRVLPTLARGETHEALEADLVALAAALVEPDIATLRDYADAARESLIAYGKSAAPAEGPDLAGIDFSLDTVTEGLPPASGRGRAPRGKQGKQQDGGSSE